jgi:REP element-mobilizing transposase RayT
LNDPSPPPGTRSTSRAIGGLLLARAAGSPQRFYSLSAQIQRERKAYYDILERTQKGTMDVTQWLAWFLDTLHRSVNQAQHGLDTGWTKARFWQRSTGTPLSERQVKLLNRLLDGFEGKLTSSKWAAIARCSPDTALRDINDLLARSVLRKSDAGGRSPSDERVHAYVLMINHVHLLVTPMQEHGIAAMMQALGRRYVRYINRRYRRYRDPVGRSLQGEPRRFRGLSPHLHALYRAQSASARVGGVCRRVPD